MATKALTEWWSEIAPDVPGVPMPAVEKAVRDICIVFCERTLLWEKELDRIDVVTATSEYALTAPDDSEIISVERVLHKANSAEDSTFVFLYPFSQTQKDFYASNNQWQFETGTPTGYYVDVDKAIHLQPIPIADSTEGLLVKVNLRPSYTCTSVEEFLYNDYYKVIGMGAKADLLSKVGQPWAKPEAATGYLTMFAEMLKAAKARKATGDMFNAVQVQTKPIIS